MEKIMYFATGVRIDELLVVKETPNCVYVEGDNEEMILYNKKSSLGEIFSTKTEAKAFLIKRREDIIAKVEEDLIIQKQYLDDIKKIECNVNDDVYKLLLEKTNV